MWRPFHDFEIFIVYFCLLVKDMRTLGSRGDKNGKQIKKKSEEELTMVYCYTDY